VNDTANEATEGQDAVASTEVEPPITSTLSYVDDFDSGYSLITVAELQDSNYDVESFVSQKLMQRIYRKLSAALVAGSTNIQSVITTATNAASSSAQTSVTWADLTALMANLDEAYQAGASFAMNQTTKFALAAMVDTLGRPIFTASAGAEQFDSILGKPIHVSVNHPNMGAGVVGAIQYGAWDQAYCLRSVADMHLFRLTERFLPDYSSYAYLVKARFGGFALNAGTNPVYNLVNHA
jgi:HK97 family phage major capsid protein